MIYDMSSYEPIIACVIGIIEITKIIFNQAINQVEIIDMYPEQE